MINLNDAIYRIVGFYNDHPEFDIQGIASHYITYSPENSLYTNTCANFIQKIQFTGTQDKYFRTGAAVTSPYFGFANDVEASGFENIDNLGFGGNFPVLSKIFVNRYEPILSIRTVFTGSNALINASLHYQRVREMIKTNGYTDMSLIGNTSFTDASIFFEGRYLIRYQSDATYLSYLEVDTSTESMDSFDELLKAYPNNQFTDLLTEREIQGDLNG